LIKEFKMKPTLISESRDSQDIGAIHMRDVMRKLGGIKDIKNNLGLGEDE